MVAEAGLLSGSAPTPVGEPPRAAGEEDRLLTSLARLLATYGTPAHRVESALSALASRWGLGSSFFATPTAVFASIDRGEATTTRLIRVQPGDVLLDKLSGLDDVLERTLAGELTPREALAHLEVIEREPALYGAAQTVAAFGLMGAAVARFFGGGIWDVAIGLIVSVVVGIVVVSAGRSGRTARVSEFFAGVVSAGLASIGAEALGASGWGAADAAVLTIAGLIVLVPGLTITIAVSELATRNMVAGSARLVGAAVILLGMGFGAAIGSRAGASIVGALGWAAPAGGAAEPMPGWTLLVALAVAPIGLAVIFQARMRDAVLFALVGGSAFWAARLTSLIVGGELAAFLAALFVGVTANLYSRARRRPTALVTMPGIMLLVPGSMGFRSVSSFLENDAVAGAQTAFQVVVVAVAIVMGLLLANAAVAPRRVL